MNKLLFLKDVVGLCSLSVKGTQWKNIVKCFLPHRKLKDTIDPNVILIDPSPLLNTEIDNIRLEFKKLLNNLKKILVEDPDDEDEYLEGIL